MSANIFFISDLHLGHKNILQFSKAYRQGTTIDEHNEWLIDSWNSVVTKRDVVYCLGDIAFSVAALSLCSRLKGNKNGILGNHDKFHISEYQRHFTVRPGVFKYKGFWLSHAPMHPQELRSIPNIHGHVHHNTIPDDRYINVCVEALNGVPVSIEELRKRTDDGRHI